MPYVGAKLAELFDDSVTANAAHDLSVAGGDMLHDQAVLFTPRDTHNLATQWYRREPRRIVMVGGEAFVTVVRNDADYAQDVEEGTGLYGPYGTEYTITPKRPGGVLSWITKHGFVDKRTGKFVPPGTRVYAKRVEHPGSRGHHMMAKAAAYVEALWPNARADEVMGMWVREMELRFVIAQKGRRV